MARQKGIIHLSGTIDDICFYQTRFGFYARKKSSLSGKRVRQDKAFERSRENAAEFTGAIQAGKLLRDSIRPLLKNTCDSLLSSRMNQLFCRIKELDFVSERGQRKAGNALLHDEGLKKLEGFNFNLNSPLEKLLLRPVDTDAATGSMNVNLPVPQKDIIWPAGASHVVLSGCVSRVRFNEKSMSTAYTNTVCIGRGDGGGMFVLTAPVPVGTDGTLFYVLRLVFVQETSGMMYPMKDLRYRALKIVKAA